MNRRFAAGALMAACTMLSFSACKMVSRGDAMASDSVLALLEECDKLHHDYKEKNARLINLSAQLETHKEANRYLQAELENTRSVLEYAERQFISLEQGLQSNETKASAVAALAEARLAYDKLLRDHPLEANETYVREALAKIQKSDDMILRNRYAASVYFGKRALRLLDERPDSDNVRIVAVDQANVRQGPGINFSVVAQIDLGTVLVQLEEKSPWFRVQTETGVSGWIHESVTVLR